MHVSISLVSTYFFPIILLSTSEGSKHASLLLKSSFTLFILEGSKISGAFKLNRFSRQRRKNKLHRGRMIHSCRQLSACICIRLLDPTGRSVHSDFAPAHWSSAQLSVNHLLGTPDSFTLFLCTHTPRPLTNSRPDPVLLTMRRLTALMSQSKPSDADLGTSS